MMNPLLWPEGSIRRAVFIRRRSLPIKMARFDTIVSLAVIEHAPDPKGFLMELAGRLEKGGRIVLTTPHPLSESNT